MKEAAEIAMEPSWHVSFPEVHFGAAFGRWVLLALSPL
jgi:hypothetical protein